MTGPTARTPGDRLAALEAQVASLRGQARAVFTRLDNAGISGDRDLAADLVTLAKIVTDPEITLYGTRHQHPAAVALAEALTRENTGAAPQGPGAPCWIGITPDQRAAQLAELRTWIDAVLRPEYDGYEIRGCWANHPHAIWELSTLAAEWHRTYNRRQPDLRQALEFHDRWLPGTMRRVAAVTRKCEAECDHQKPGKNETPAGGPELEP
jgi:hypothetical protein